MCPGPDQFLLTLQTSTSAPSRASARTETVWTHWAASSAPARPVWCWTGTAVWVCTTSTIFSSSSTIHSLTHINLRPPPSRSLLWSRSPVSSRTWPVLPHGVQRPRLRAATVRQPHTGGVLLHSGQSLGAQLWAMSSAGNGWAGGTWTERRCQPTVHYSSFKLVACCLLYEGSPLAGWKAGWAHLPGVKKKNKYRTILI